PYTHIDINIDVKIDVHVDTPSEGSRAVRIRTAAVVPPPRYEVILVSSAVRCPLRGRHRKPATSI
ncbi:hypothetical protein ACWGIV_36965, partial [Streptomyces sp. NPDC054844]